MSNETVIVGLNIRKEPNGRSDKLGLLPRGACIEIGEHSTDGKWGRIKQVVEGKIAPVRLGDPVDPSAATGWVFLGELDVEPTEPEAFDSIVVPSKPIPIKAGALVGHLGEYQLPEDAQPTAQRNARPLLHLEVFSGDNVPTFINQSRSYARTLPPGSGSLLVIEQGAKPILPAKSDVTLQPGEQFTVLPDSPKTGRFAKIARIALQVLERSKLGSFQESTNTYSTGAIWTGWYVGARNDQRTQNKADAESKGYNRREVLAPTGAALWVDRTAWRDGNAQRVVVGKQPLPVWSAFPLQLKNEKAPEVGFTRVVARTELEQMPPADQAVDPQGNRWWRLNVRTTSTDPSNNMFSGAWVCEKGHEKVSWQSPWAWPGFEFVEEGGIEPIDLAASNYHRTGTAEPDERKDFKTRADKVDKSVLVKKLYEFIDQNKDDEVDAQELKKAFQQPLLAQALTRIIAQYESEWGGEMAKWNELDPLMLDDKADWEAEKLRIDQLRWWPKVAAKVKGFPSSPLAYHFHPIGLINNFMSRSAGCCEITVEFLEKVLGKSGTWFNGKGGGKLFEERFKTNYPAVYKMDKAKFVTMLNEALDRHEINECYQKAHFLAQCFHECAHFETTLEFGSGKNYDPGVHGDAEKNGNTKVGDGPRYRGRGLIQLTWKNNYKKYSDYRGIDFTANPELIASDMYNSIDASCWYWRHNGTIHKKHDAKGDINKLIAAEKNNVTLITLAVNGGDNGLAERKSLFATIKTEWGLK